MPYYSLQSTLKWIYDVVIEIKPTICQRIEIIFDAFLVTSMLVTDFDNEMCWWQARNVGDRHNDSVANILDLSPL